MYPEYATWERGSHGRVATCNDCHVPQDNFIRKYAFKASDGFRHASMFTFRMEPQVIRIKEAGRNVVQENCIRCHSNYLHPVSLRAIGAKSIYEESDKLCWDCHRETPHGRVHSLSSAENIIRPELKPVVPEWIKQSN
jgi:cytochrome c nitrite reductase small subunit